MNIVDIHTHVLPGLDDGPANLDETFALMQDMEKNGTDRVIATPHYLHPQFEVTSEAIQSSHDRMLKHLEHEPSNLHVKVGAEVRVTHRLMHYVRTGTIPTLGATRYVLLEFPHSSISRLEYDIVHELRVSGYVPIVAHPERHAEFAKNADVVSEFRKFGAIMQVTAACFSGTVSRRMSSVAWRWLKNGDVDVIASDAHDTQSRPPGLLAAFNQISLRLGQRSADQLIDNANAIWNGDICSSFAAKRHGT